MSRLISKHLLTPLLCFYSRSTYREVAIHWNGLALAYTFMIITASWVSVLPLMQKSVSHHLATNRQAMALVPPLKMEAGRLSSTAEMPVVIGNLDDSGPLIVIDTRDGVDTPVWPAPHARASTLITADKITLRERSGDTRVFELSALPDFTIDAAGLERWNDLAEKLLAPLLLCIIVPIYFLFYIFKTLVWSGLAMLLSAVAKRSRSFGSMFRVTVVASTPSLVTSTLLAYSGAGVSWQWVLPVVTVLYVAYAVSALPKNAS